PPAIAQGVAISYAALGAVMFAKAAAAPVPPLAMGTEDWEGGMARIGEVGTEIVKEPGKRPYKVSYETVKYLPRGTQVIPTYSIPTISEGRSDSSWEQTKYLASVIKKGQKRTERKLENHIHVDLGWETYKMKILYGKV